MSLSFPILTEEFLKKLQENIVHLQNVLDQDFHITLQSHRPLAVAVSGGPDSLALTLGLHKLSLSMKFQVIALGIDHGLRPESLGEMLWLKNQSDAYGIPFFLLPWEHRGLGPTGNILKKARKKRYELLIHACHLLNIPMLFLGHHHQDHLETVWMRQEKGSHWRGLAGIAWLSQRNGILLARPLLNFPKESLECFLENQKQSWIKDPSNHDQRFKRSQLRNLPIFKDRDPKEPLFDLSYGWGEQRFEESLAINKALKRYGTLYPEGHLRLEPGFWNDLQSFDQNEKNPKGKEFFLGALLFLIEIVRGVGPFLKATQWENLYQSLFQSPQKHITLGGCHFIKKYLDHHLEQPQSPCHRLQHTYPQIWMFREVRTLSQEHLIALPEESLEHLKNFPKQSPTHTIHDSPLYSHTWDQRFLLKLPQLEPQKPWMCKPLGIKSSSLIFSSWGIPKDSFLCLAWSSMPALWHKDSWGAETIAMVPALGNFQNFPTKNPKDLAGLFQKTPISFFPWTLMKKELQKILWYGPGKKV
jgi:tRNA(Ile)-lysidine synthetase-like protein